MARLPMRLKQKFMEFFKNLASSFYKPAFYSATLQKPVSYSFKNFFLFALILALILTGVYSFIYFPKIKTFLDNVVTQGIDAYPDGLKIEIKNGSASANAPQPYFVKLPGFFAGNPNQLENLFVIDTNNEFSTEKFNEYKTLVVLNKSSIAAFDNKDQIKIIPLKDVKDFILDKQTVNSFYEKVKPWFKSVYPIFLFGSFLLVFLMISMHLVYLFFGALLVWIIAKIKGIKMGYWKSYQAGIHLIMPVILITTIIGFFGFRFPFLFTLLLIIMAILNLENIRTSAKIEHTK